MNIKNLLWTAYLFSIINVIDSNLTKSANTCQDCSANHRHQPMERFKACKLISIRTVLNSCLNVITDLQQQIILRYSGVTENDFYSGEEIPTVLQVETFLNSTYTRLQDIYAGQKFLHHFNTFYSLDLQTSHLSRHTKTVLCKIEPVLRHGHFYGRAGAVTCEVARTVSAADRTSSINWIINYLRYSGNVLTHMIDNINLILVSREI